jgi:hypothetical protein
MPYYTPIEASQSSVCIARFVRDVKEGNVDQFMQRLSSLFADTPYELVKELENHYQNVLFIVYKLMGFYVKAEYHTSQGRIDLMLQTPAYTYIFEFKFNGTAEAALSQIKEKNYAAPFLTDPDRRIILVGVNFSSATRNIDAWLTSSL